MAQRSTGMDGTNENAYSSAPGTDEEFAELLVQHSPDVLALLRDGRVTWLSPNAPQVLGWTDQKAMNASIDSLVHPDDESAVRNACLSASSGDRVALVAHARAGAGGHMLPVEMRFGPREVGGAGSDVAVTLRVIDDVFALRDAVTAATRADRRLAERAGDAIFIVDQRGTVVDAGANAYDMLGWHPDEVLGVHLPDLVHPADRNALEAYRRDVQRDMMVGSVELRARTRGGRYRWVLATGLLLHTRPGAAPDDDRVLVSWRDIDGLVRQARLAERETERLRVIMDTALDPWLHLTPLRDRHGEIADFIIEDANEGAAEYLRWPRERVLGARLLEEFPNVAEHGLMAAYVESMDTGEPVVIHDLRYPHEVFDETRLYELRARPVGDSLMLTWRDTTPESLARDALAENESLFRGIASAAGNALVMVTQGDVAWASPGAQHMGLATGTDFEEVMTGLVVPDSAAAVRACGLLIGQGHNYRGRWHRRAGPPLVVSATTLPGADEPGIVTMIEEAWTAPSLPQRTES